jgi:hypothetical protein
MDSARRYVSAAAAVSPDHWRVVTDRDPGTRLAFGVATVDGTSKRIEKKNSADFGIRVRAGQRTIAYVICDFGTDHGFFLPEDELPSESARTIQCLLDGEQHFYYRRHADLLENLLGESNLDDRAAIVIRLTDLIRAQLRALESPAAARTAAETERMRKIQNVARLKGVDLKIAVREILDRGLAVTLRRMRPAMDRTTPGSCTALHSVPAPETGRPTE